KLSGIHHVIQFAEIKAEAFANNPFTEESTANFLYGDPDDPATLTPFNWVDAIFRESANQDILNLRLSGGNDRTTFFISGSMEGTQGQVIKSEYNRQTFRINVSHAASERLQLGTTLGITRQNLFGTIANGNFVNSPLQSAFVSQPNSPAFDEDGTFAPYPTSGSGHQFGINILQSVNDERRESVAAQVVGGLQLDYQILPSLSLNVFGGIDFLDAQSVNERLLTFASFGGFGGTVLVDDRREFNWNTNANLRYLKQVKNNHLLLVNVGVEAKEEMIEENTATARGFANPFVRVLDGSASPQSIGGSLGSWTRGGAYANIEYTISDKYTFETTFRRDGSSRFGTVNRFGSFWAVGAAWNAKKESFLVDSKLLSQLNFRLSYGVLGSLNNLENNQAIGAAFASQQYLGNAGQRLVLSNDLLRWQESAHLNAGMDFAFFNNRLAGSVEVFRTNTDQLLSKALPQDSGAESILSNEGNVRNSGVEVTLSGTVMNTEDFRWTTTGNITFQENELTLLTPGADRIGDRFIKGQSTEVVWGLEYVGVNPANGRAMWKDNTGTVKYGDFDTSDGKVLGSVLPNVLGGLSNTFTYKGFSLDVFFQYQLGVTAVNADLYNLAASGSRGDNQLVSQLDRWQQPGDITNVPIAYEGEVIEGYNQTLRDVFGLRNSRFVSDASYIRLRRIMLSYDVPSSLTKKLHLTGARVFIQGNNLLTFTKYDGIDPEVATLGNELRGGAIFHSYPVAKLISAGVTVRL
ncbi:MAG: SusC/RagA family TonB-linked outer membrane protein, partial [Bacteroidota bacterium]